jgi:[protein-PII] uridylyltransferase
LVLEAGAIAEPPGPTWCRSWTALIDAALRRWLSEHGVSGGVAVVALGGYARRELCPGSDVDVLLLHDGWGRHDLEALVQALCYPLWDAGLAVGHAVRTPRQAVQAAAERIDSATALTDRRLVVGDVGLADELGSRVARWLRRQGGRVLSALAEADAERHRRAGDQPGMLEPDLKEGAGGLRDLHSLRWAAACVLGEVGLDPLVGARYLGATDRRELAGAGECLLTARCALHLIQRGGGRRRAQSDRLRLDLHDEVAARAGLGDGLELLRRVGLASRTIAHLHGRTWPALLADARGGRRRRHPPPEPVGPALWLADGLIELEAGATLALDQSLGLRAVAAAAVHGTHLGREAAARLRRELERLAGVPRSLVWDARARGALLTTLREGERALPALADAGHLGVLAAYLPEWSRVRGRPQRNPFHRYDLDTHAVVAVAELRRVIEGELDPRHAEVHGLLRDPDALLLATFLHDIGKAWPGRHSVAGARVARDWVLRMGFEQRRAEHVAQLVRLHLLLPDASTRRDLDDEHDLAHVAAEVGDAETLHGLYLLSIADARATGPAAHSAWKDSLLAELHRRVARILAGHGMGAGQEPGGVVADARRLLGPAAAAVPASILERLPRRYLRTAGPEQVAEHLRLLLPFPGTGELRTSRRPGPAPGTATLTVVGADRVGLMADCAGVLAAAGVGVLDAHAFTHRFDAGAIALDWFVVRDGEDIHWEQVAADLRGVGDGAMDVAAAVRRREARRDARPRPLADPVPIEVDFGRGALLTRIEVHAPDSPGLLYRLARVLADAGLDVVGARVTTLGPAVRDVFFVRQGGGPPDEAGLRSSLQLAADPSSVG